MTNSKKNLMDDDLSLDQDLETLFSAARESAYSPSDALLAKILADAQEEQKNQKIVHFPQSHHSASLWQKIQSVIEDTLGGWKAASAICMAGLFGVTVGLNAETLLSDFALGYWESGAIGSDNVSEFEFSSFDALLEES